MAYEAKTYDRHHRILQMLSSGRYRTVQEVKVLLEAQGDSLSDRQIKRILDGFCRQHGLNAHKRYGGRGKPPTEYGWSTPSKAPQVGHVDDLRALTLHLAAELLDPLLPSSVLDHLHNELKIAKSLLVHDSSPSAQRFPSKIAVLPRGIGRPQQRRTDSRNLATIYEALLKEQRLNVGYSAQFHENKAPKTYELSPLGLICRLDTLYLVHVCEPSSPDKDPNRVMEWPLQRFSRVALLDKPIRKLPGFNLKEHLKYPGIVRNIHDGRLLKLGREFKLKVLCEPTAYRYIDERRFSKDQVGKPRKDGRYEVTATVLNTRDLLSELFNFADDIEVVSPSALREYLREKAERTAARHQARPRKARTKSS